MLIFLVLALIIAAFLLLSHYKISHFKENMSEEQRAKWDAAMEDIQRKQEIKSKGLQALAVYRTLRDSVRDDMTLEEMVDAFADMCVISVGEPDDLLFETGTYNFTGETLFYFSLVRQFKFTSGDEYVQLHLDVLYTPSPATKLLFGSKWDSQINGSFFEMVKTSRAFATVCSTPPFRVDVHIEQT